MGRPPSYDAAAHKLYWAKELMFGTDMDHTLNYNIRVLGRRGVLVLNAVAEMKQLAVIRTRRTTSWRRWSSTKAIATPTTCPERTRRRPMASPA